MADVDKETSVPEQEDCTKEEELPNYLLVDKHLKYFEQILGLVPKMYQSIDSSRLTVLYFSLSGMLLF